MVINRTLKNGKKDGYISGAGAGLADMVYAGIAAFSVTALHAYLLKKKLLLEIVGAVALISFGLHTFGKEPTADEERQEPHHKFISAFGLTLANPMTLVAFFAIFAGLHLSERAFFSDLMLSLGIFGGSFAWWIVLSKIAHKTKHQFSHSSLHRLNQLAGLLIALAGIIILYRMI